MLPLSFAVLALFGLSTHCHAAETTVERTDVVQAQLDALKAHLRSARAEASRGHELSWCAHAEASRRRRTARDAVQAPPAS